MKTLILSFLLHHANRLPLYKDSFYAIKKRVLDYYGKPDGEDLQILPGKKCWTCNGTGVYVGYNWYGNQYRDHCNRCIGGWYQLPTYVVLQRLRYGGYLFHQPIARYEGMYSLPEKWKPLEVRQAAMHGYKEFKLSPWTEEAHLWLFLLYDRSRFRQMWQCREMYTESVGILATLHRLKKYCIEDYERRREHLDFGQKPVEPKPVARPVYQYDNDDDLPF